MVYFHDNIQLKQSNQRKQNCEQKETGEKGIGSRDCRQSSRAFSRGTLVTPISKTAAFIAIKKGLFCFFHFDTAGYIAATPISDSFVVG